MLQYIGIISSDPIMRKLDDDVRRVFDSIQLNPLLQNPVIVRGLVFGANTDLVVSHKLNKNVTGYILIGSTAAASLYTSPTANLNTKQLIILRTSAAITASILFF